MTKGRKPTKNAQRRGGHEPAQELVAEVIGAVPTLQKPVSVAVNPVMSECWDSLIGSAPCFDERDIPLIESYCFWYAVFCEASQSMMSLDGRVSTLVEKYDAETGEPEPGSAKANPNLRTAEKATTMLRQLGDALNISPTARVRSGLMQAMTASTVEDLARRTSEGYSRFKASQAKGALPNAKD